MYEGVDASLPQAEQLILYEGDGVEVSFSDGGRLQLSPCGTTFLYQQMSPLSAGPAIQQKAQFATSVYRPRVKDALDFRNRFAHLPFLCEELLEPEFLIRNPMDIFEVSWPLSVASENVLVLADGSMKLSSATRVGSQPVAVVWLSSTSRTFIVRYLAKLKHNAMKTSVSQNTSHVPSQTVSSSSASGPNDSVATRHSNSSSLLNLRRVINFDDGENSISPQSLSSDTDTGSVPGLGYAWVSQHHSLSSYPPCWSHPVQLLVEFRQSASFLSYLNRLRTSTNYSASADFAESVESNSELVMSTLPTSMPLRCQSPHVHRWNPSATDDVCGYFHDKVKVIAIKGTIYRLLWNTNSRSVEVYPPDGSIIRSTSTTGHHFTHYFFSQRSQQIEERTYSSQSPPAKSTDVMYSVSRMVVMANRLFQLMSDKYLDLATNRSVCWQVDTASCSKLNKLRSNHVIDECYVQGVGRFTAYLNGNIHIVFDDRTCLDMHGIQWESHVYRKLLHSASSDDEVERFMGEVKLSRSQSPVDFPNDVCRLLLPSGHYQHVDILKPHHLYERFVSVALEYALWVNTPLSQRQSFYCDSLSQQRSVADVKLKKIQCFTYMLDRGLGSSMTSPLSLTSPASSSQTSAGAAINDIQSVAQQALNNSAEILKDLDSFILANERR